MAGGLDAPCPIATVKGRYACISELILGTWNPVPASTAPGRLTAYDDREAGPSTANVLSAGMT